MSVNRHIQQTVIHTLKWTEDNGEQMFLLKTKASGPNRKQIIQEGRRLGRRSSQS